MTTVLEENVIGRPYTLRASNAARRLEVVPMVDSQGIVFVVDDDVSVRESLELLLKHAGWQPHTFESAQEFLACPRPLAANWASARSRSRRIEDKCCVK